MNILPQPAVHFWDDGLSVEAGDKIRYVQKDDRILGQVLLATWVGGNLQILE